MAMGKETWGWGRTDVWGREERRKARREREMIRSERKRTEGERKS